LLHEEQGIGGYEEIDAVADPDRAEDEGVADVAVGAVHLAVVNDESDAWSADEERSIGSARSEPASWVWRSSPLVRPSSSF
jgi:hypothetical protein